MSGKDEIKAYWEERAKTNAETVTSTTDDVYLRELEIQTIVDEIRRLPIRKGDTVVDIGCGDGYSTINAALKLTDLYFLGVDYSQNMIANANKRLVADPQLTKQINFAVADVTNLDSFFSNILFSCVITDRCLINLESYESQMHAVSQIANHVMPDGHYIAIENFVEGHDNMNEVRKAIGLPEIKTRWHNLFFTEERFANAVQPFFEIVEIKDFTSSYYYATRVIYSKMCQMRNQQPDYLHDIHKLAIDLPSFGKFSPIRMAILKRI